MSLSLALVLTINGTGKKVTVGYIFALLFRQVAASWFFFLVQLFSPTELSCTVFRILVCAFQPECDLGPRNEAKWCLYSVCIHATADISHYIQTDGSFSSPQ